MKNHKMIYSIQDMERAAKLRKLRMKLDMVVVLITTITYFALAYFAVVAVLG